MTETIGDFLCHECWAWDDTLTPDDMICENCKSIFQEA